MTKNLRAVNRAAQELPERGGEPLPGAGGDRQGRAVAVGGVADHDHRGVAGGFYAVPAGGV